MKIKRIEHIAIAVKSMAQSREIFEAKLGLSLEYEEYLPQYNTRLAMYPVGQTYIELLESGGDNTETARWIAEHGEGHRYRSCIGHDLLRTARLRGGAHGLIFPVRYRFCLRLSLQAVTPHQSISFILNRFIILAFPS